MPNIITLLKKRDAVDREAALMNRQAQLQSQLAQSQAVLLALVEDVEAMPQHVTITAGHVRQHRLQGELAVAVPFPPQLQTTLSRARSILGGVHYA